MTWAKAWSHDQQRGAGQGVRRTFRAVYLVFRRRDAPRSQLPNASMAVLEHLALAGPLTIGEAAAHLPRGTPEPVLRNLGAGRLGSRFQTLDSIT